mgnify:FL=1
MNKLKLLDLFSGIGGFSYGLEQTQGFETIAFCEKDKFCQQVLRKHWNDIKIYDDIRDIKGSTIKADIVTGGFPCQPFSVAGKQRGTDDDRYLWDETIRVVAETKPRWFIGENVDGLVNIQEGKVLQQIQKDLETESFEVQCLIIPASGIGAWHQRKRIWIIGYSDSNANTKTQQSSNGPENSISKEYRSKDSSVQFSGGTTNNSLSNSTPINLRNANSTSIESSINRQEERKFRRASSRRQQRQETWWQTQSKLCGVPDGISTELDKDRANRIKSLGNSIVPEIARELGLSILEAENEQIY